MGKQQQVIEVQDDAQHLSRTAKLVQEADSLSITTDVEQEKAAEIGKNLKAFFNEAEAFFAPEIEQAHALHKSLCAKRNKVLDPIRAALLRLGSKLGVYQEAVRKAQAEAEEKARIEAEEKTKKEQDKILEKAAAADGQGNTEKADDLFQKAQEVYVAPRPVAQAVKPQGTSLRFNVEVVIKDASKVPDKYKIIDEAKLKRAFKDENYTLVVPGVVFVKKPISGFRG